MYISIYICIYIYIYIYTYIDTYIYIHHIPKTYSNFPRCSPRFFARLAAREGGQAVELATGAFGESQSHETIEACPATPQGPLVSMGFSLGFSGDVIGIDIFLIFRLGFSQTDQFELDFMVILTLKSRDVIGLNQSSPTVEYST